MQLAHDIYSLTLRVQLVSLENNTWWSVEILNKEWRWFRRFHSSRKYSVRHIVKK